MGCTHYGIAKNEFKKNFPKNVKIISQNDVVPKKTKEYFVRHPEIESKLSKNKTREFYVTDVTETMKKMAAKWFGSKITVQKVDIESVV